MPRRSYNDEFKEAERLRGQTPRAASLSEVLFDLACKHKSEGLEALAIEVDGEHCQTGREISLVDIKNVIERAARALGAS
jgi:hypothetical protein